MDRLTREQIEEWRHRLSALWMTGKTIKESQDSANALCDMALQSLFVRSEARRAALEEAARLCAPWESDENPRRIPMDGDLLAAAIRALSPARVAEELDPGDRTGAFRND